MIVWVLVLYFSGYKAGGPVVIDNIASAESCAQLAKVIKGDDRVETAICAPVRKVKP